MTRNIRSRRLYINQTDILQLLRHRKPTPQTFWIHWHKCCQKRLCLTHLQRQIPPPWPTLKRACNSTTPDIVLANRQGNLNYHNHRHCHIHQPNHGPYTFPRDPRRFPWWCMLFTNHASLYILYSFCCCCFHFHHKCSKTIFRVFSF